MKYDVEKWKRMDIQLNGSEVADHPCSQFHFHLCVHTMQTYVTQTALSTNSNSKSDTEAKFYTARNLRLHLKEGAIVGELPYYFYGDCYCHDLCLRASHIVLLPFLEVVTLPTSYSQVTGFTSALFAFHPVGI